MRTQELYDWLLEHGGPVIRYRTATELVPPAKSPGAPRLAEELMQSPLVRMWLDRLVPASFLTEMPEQKIWALIEVHSAAPAALENVIPKLTGFGLRRGMPEFDQRILPYRRWVEKNSEHRPSHIHELSILGLTTVFLAHAGYVNEPGVAANLRNRLDIVYDFVRRGDYDIYVMERGNVPKVSRGHPLIRPDLTRGGVVSLPMIYDIVGWAAYLSGRDAGDDWAKADAVINYILCEEYQRLPFGYGVMTDGAGGFWSLGCSIHMPGFTDSLSPERSKALRVWLADLLMSFRAARRHPWLRESLDHLEGFRTERGTYLFPRSYLQERTQGMWINGHRMGLEENRRRSLALELESTFWMARLRRAVSAPSRVDASR